MRNIFILTALVFLGVVFYQTQATSSLPQIVYQLPQPKLWQRDLEIAEEIEWVGPEHFYFAGTDNIDLNVMPIDDDLYKSFLERGEKQFIKDTMRGKNLIDGMFGVEPAQLVKHTSQKLNDAIILEINTTQRLPDGQYEILEKYFIYPGQAINFQLRWPQTADGKKVLEAQNAFAQLAPKSRSSRSVKNNEIKQNQKSK